MLSSAEVGTLITALGCGIGKEEFDANKLRYHRIIIMTDADVDGSHIRTLLLTFFYRQMRELIERGHIYIGLPPLYKVKQGKQEMYMKDDAALNAYLISNAVEGSELHYSPDAPPINAESLERLLKDYQAARDLIRRLALRFDGDVLEALLRVPPLPPEAFSDPAKGEAWIMALSNQINASGLGKPRYQLRLQGGDEAGLIVVRDHHGLTRQQRLPEGFFQGSEYRQLSQVAQSIHDLIQPGAQVVRGTRSAAVSDFAGVVQWLMDEAKRGRSIQRFKGLGEMNPEQLWETTVNPETRRLLQVTIEDAVAADEMFSMLMGEAVEPRRNFIEANALRVANLDV